MEIMQNEDYIVGNTREGLKLQIKKDKKPCYPIYFFHDFSYLKNAMEELNLSNRKVCIFTDNKIKEIYGEIIKKELEPISKQVVIFSFLSGEENKTLETVQSGYKFLIENKIERTDLLVALGGGVVGDLCGFTAATYLRGIDFIQIPTTLLAQVDSSIGGKTGVDFDQYKNMVGAFNMPKFVYINTDVLNTLDERQFSSGMAEVIKYGLIMDAPFYEWLLNNFTEINDREPDVLLPMIFQCCICKKKIVEKDPFEKGDRALLNFGHTLGHAIEKYKKFTLYHGECVALGMVAAAYISWKRNMLKTEDYYEIRDMMVPFQLPISIEDLEIETIIENTTSDKKMENGIVKFILLNKIGKAVVERTVSLDEMRDALNEIHYIEEINE